MKATLTAAQILADTRKEFAAAIADKRLCYDLTHHELYFDSEIRDMAMLDGGCQIREQLNDLNAWGKTVGEVASDLANSIAMGRAIQAGLGEWDDLGAFLADAK